MSQKETIDRLLKSGLCACNDAATHVEELRRMAVEKADLKKAKRVSRIHKALGDESRIRILHILGDREYCVCEIMAALDMTQPTASHHLKILEQEELVSSRKDGKWVFYRVTNPDRLMAMQSLGLF